jgi:hypothetical protein
MRRRKRGIRLGVAFALVCAIAGITAGSAGALAFVQGDPCQDTQPLFVCPQGGVGAAYSITLKASGGNGEPYTYILKAGALPSGLKLEPSTGVISGTPTAAGSSTFGLELQDKPADPGCPGCGCVVRNTCAYRDFKIDVLAGISIDNQSVPPGTIGQAYSQTLTATMITATDPRAGNPATDVTWSLASGALPEGVTLSPQGALAGTPTTEGSYQFVVQAQRDAKQVDTETLTIVVRTPVVVSPLSATWAGRHGSEVGVAIDASLSATGGTGTYAWALGGGTLPTGLTLGADGTITGTPSTSGKFSFVAQATDTEGRTATLTVPLTVAAKPEFKTLALKTAKVGRLYNAKLKTVGGVLPVKWKILRGTLPRGVHFAKKLGVFIGTPKRVGSYRLTVQVTDGYGVKALKTFTLLVKA